MMYRDGCVKRIWRRMREQGATPALIICQFVVRRKRFSLLADIDFFLQSPLTFQCGGEPAQEAAKGQQLLQNLIIR
jgi:hypothetical protein